MGRVANPVSRWRYQDAPSELGRILEPPPKARGNGARLCAEHQPQRHGEATRFGIIRRLWASALAAAGPSDTAAVRWRYQDAPGELSDMFRRLPRQREDGIERCIPWPRVHHSSK